VRFCLPETSFPSFGRRLDFPGANAFEISDIQEDETEARSQTIRM
jgi:hypothetical protein